jgi:hypothetical protein
VTPAVRRPWSDGAIAAALAACAFVVGVLYCTAFERTHPPPEPWVRELGAAVAFACGHGFVDPGYEPTPELAAFLAKKIDRISCSALPSNVPTRPANFTQRLYRYMTLAVAITWRAFGISWTNVALLLGLLHAATAAVVYALFRLATSRAASAVGAAIVTVSPLQLRYLPQMRDYAKAPFLLALILILAVLAIRPFTPRRLLTLSIAYGAIAGLGFGFRNDLLIAAPPYLVTVLLFLPAPWRAHAGARLAAIAASLATFVVCAWPVIAAYRSGSNSGHVALLGLMTSFDKPLGVTRSVYDWGSLYDDGYAVKVISSYSERVHKRRVDALSPGYDRAMVEYLALIARHWPADLLVRAYASVLRSVDLPFQLRLYTTAAPPGIDGRGPIARAYDAWVGALSVMSGLGAVLAAGAILAAAGASVRIGAWLAMAILYFGGYPAVQFDARHFFFLECVGWIALMWVATAAVRFSRMPPAERASAARRGAIFGAALAAAIVVPLAALRAYQQRHVTHLIEAYLDAPTMPIAVSAAPAADARTLLQPVGLSRSPEPDVRAEYVAADIGGRDCGAAMVPVTVRYATLPGYTDLSQQFDVAIERSGPPFRLLLPVYYSPGGYFAGIEVPDGDRQCVPALRRATRIDEMPVLPTLTLPPGWRDLPLYQTLTPRGVRFWRHG